MSQFRNVPNVGWMFRSFEFRAWSLFRVSCFGFRICSLIGALSLVLAGGCQPVSKGPPLVPAEGIVTLDGKPLAGANVMLQPQGETRGDKAFYGKTDESGKFVAASADGKQKGAAVGTYKVVINKLVKPDGSDFIPDPNSGPEDTGGFRKLLPDAYSDEAKSILTADVPDGGAKTLEFKLSSKQK
jgi:hypothetical protein